MRDMRTMTRRGVLDLPLYPLSRSPEELAAEYGLAEIIRLDQNENPLGASPAALEALRREAPLVNRYPDSGCAALSRALAGRMGVEPGMILFDNAADGCISLVCGTFLNEGDEAVLADPTFAVYETAVKVAGGRPVKVPLRDGVHDLEAMADAVGPRTRLVFVCNPNNPTGTVVPGEALGRLFERLPGHVVVVLDEAYREYVREGYPDLLEHVRRDRPLLVLRSFSKVYGLAGLRIGYLTGPADLIEACRRVREVFPVSRPAQAAALAALGDEEFVRRVVRVNREGREYLGRELSRLGLHWTPSEANFVFVDLKRDVRAVQEGLARRGILVRPGSVWGLPSAARITIGTMEQNRKLIGALEAVLAEPDGVAGPARRI